MIDFDIDARLSQFTAAIDARAASRRAGRLLEQRVDPSVLAKLRSLREGSTD